MITLSTAFSPIRAVEGQKEPVILEVTVKNETEKSILVSLVVKAPFDLGFDKVGLMRESRKRIGYVKENSSRTVPVVMYCKSTIKAGDYPVQVKAIIHRERYDQTEKEINQPTSLRVISP